MESTLDRAAGAVRTQLTKMRWALGLNGALSVALGVMILVWPGISLFALTIIFGAYALATRAFPDRRPTDVSRSIPHCDSVDGRRPNRPPVIEYAARCTTQIVRTSHRGTITGLVADASDIGSLLGRFVSTV